MFNSKANAHAKGGRKKGAKSSKEELVARAKQARAQRYSTPHLIMGPSCLLSLPFRLVACLAGSESPPRFFDGWRGIASALFDTHPLCSLFRAGPKQPNTGIMTMQNRLPRRCFAKFSSGGSRISIWLRRCGLRLTLCVKATQ
jgi:hypothetical protein